MTDDPIDRITRRQTLVAIVAAGMATAMARPAHTADYGAFNQEYAEKIVLPAFANLSTAARALSDAATQSCAGTGVSDLPALKESYGAAADAWADAQMFRFGPMADGQRAERFAYWPERRNIIDKQLSALLASEEAAGITAARLGDSSVAVQGLPALERLLYRDDPLPATGCAIIRAIAGNLSAIAVEAQAAWTGAADEPAPFAANPVEAATQFYTNILTLLQIVAEQKIGAPLGGDVTAAKPKAAEQWRSARSLRNIRRNLAAARQAVLAPGGFGALLGPDQATLRDRLSESFAAALTAAEAAGDDLSAAVMDDSRRRSITDLLVRVNHLRDLLRQDVPPVIGITLGFNELDGDGS